MDDFVLNFAAPSAPNQSAASSTTTGAAKAAKGGRVSWRDKAKLKHQQQSSKKKLLQASLPSPSGAPTSAPSTQKRPRDDNGDNEDSGVESTEPALKHARPTSNAPAPPSAKQVVGPSGKVQYISSLFTAEGLPTPTPLAPVIPSRPSNAPLTSTAPIPTPSASTSTSLPDPAPALTALGLLPPLVNHLATKLLITSPTACQQSAIPSLLSISSPTDAILKAQTGSGKTLAFLLPLVQDLLSLPPSLFLSSSEAPTRAIGTLALILAPTRELAQQTYLVLEQLLSLPSAGGFSFPPRALTPCLLVGGANRTHEKRRLRKGCPIVVATPGRLLDHLRTTECFKLAGEAATTKGPRGRGILPGSSGAGSGANSGILGTRGAAAGKKGKLGLRWLIIDECDRLMDLGFEEQMRGVLEELERRSPNAGLGKAELGRRRTVLCSATAGEGVEKLKEMAARDPVILEVDGGVGPGVKLVDVLKGKNIDEDDDEDEEEEGAADAVEEEAITTIVKPSFTAPSQLLHSYIICPPKLRFVTLIALLRRALLPSSKSASNPQKGGNKILVFFSCTAAVDFFWEALDHLSLSAAAPPPPPTNVIESAKDRVTREKAEEEAERTKLVSKSQLLPGAQIFRLHGNLDLSLRLKSLKDFSKKGEAGVMFCTSVAARGLDVGGVGLVVQVDLATEGGVTEYIHRAGRTARAGAQGQAISLLLPSEKDWVPWVEAGMKEADRDVKMRELAVENVLKDGFGGEGREYETRATDVQMGFERWVAETVENSTLARNAFASHVRAYATHPSSEKSMFNTKLLHLGHLAKSFGMRDAPGASSSASSKKKSKKQKDEIVNPFPIVARSNGGGFETGRRHDEERAKKRRNEKIMKGPLQTDAGEYQVASQDMLEMLAKAQGSGGGKRKK